MDTTIQISQNLRNVLQMRKISDKEKYEDIIWDLIEDNMELSKETKENIAESEKEIKAGKTIPFEQIKKEFELNV